MSEDQRQPWPWPTEQRYEYTFRVWPTNEALNAGNIHFAILFQVYGHISVTYTEAEFTAFRAGLLAAKLELRDIFRQPCQKIEYVP